jgi:hypothetical protein
MRGAIPALPSVKHRDSFTFTEPHHRTVPSQLASLHLTYVLIHHDGSVINFIFFKCRGYICTNMIRKILPRHEGQENCDKLSIPERLGAGIAQWYIVGLRAG